MSSSVDKVKSEMASLGLFHSLRNIGDPTVALGEMRRFLSISPSAEYARIVEDLAKECAGKLGGRHRATA